MNLISIIGAIVILVTLFDFYRALACRSWSSTQGTITAANASIVSNYQQTRKLFSTKNSVNFYYQYAVNGENYLGSRIFFGDTFLSLFSFVAAKGSVEKYKENQTVTVYYNPAKPQDSVLEPGIKWQAVAAFLLGGVLIAIAPMF